MAHLHDTVCLSRREKRGLWHHRLTNVWRSCGQENLGRRDLLPPVRAVGQRVSGASLCQQVSIGLASVVQVPLRRAASRSILFVLTLWVWPVAGQTSAAPVANQPLRVELLELARDDQADREGFSDAIKANDPEYAKRLIEKDAARTLRLKAIIAGPGWPTATLVGRDGVDAAWLLLQHSADLAWQKTMLPVLEQAAAAGEIRRGDVALLTDRVLVRSGQPQRYGSSFSVVDGRLVADPIDDESNVDDRRAEVGLAPMAEYARLLADMYKMSVEWPRKK